MEVRIADKDTTAEIAPLQDIIEVSVPTIDLSATTGADGTEDGSKVLLSPVSSNMMYVYSVADNQMWREPYNLDGYDLYRISIQIKFFFRKGVHMKKMVISSFIVR